MTGHRRARGRRALLAGGALTLTAIAGVTLAAARDSDPGDKPGTVTEQFFGRSPIPGWHLIVRSADGSETDRMVSREAFRRCGPPAPWPACEDAA